MAETDIKAVKKLELTEKIEANPKPPIHEAPSAAAIVNINGHGLSIWSDGYWTLHAKEERLPAPTITVRGLRPI